MLKRHNEKGKTFDELLMAGESGRLTASRRAQRNKHERKRRGASVAGRLRDAPLGVNVRGVVNVSQCPRARIDRPAIGIAPVAPFEWRPSGNDAMRVYCGRAQPFSASVATHNAPP